MGDNALACSLAHTGYVIRTENGKALKYVYNSRNPTDPQPTRVALPPGRYQIEAQAEEAGRNTVTVVLPVLIEPGKTTVAHLSGHWKPKVQFSDSDVVRLPDGQSLVGWRDSRRLRDRSKTGVRGGGGQRGTVYRWPPPPPRVASTSTTATSFTVAATPTSPACPASVGVAAVVAFAVGIPSSTKVTWPASGSAAGVLSPILQRRLSCWLDRD